MIVGVPILFRHTIVKSLCKCCLTDAEIVHDLPLTPNTLNIRARKVLCDLVLGHVSRLLIDTVKLVNELPCLIPLKGKIVVNTRRVLDSHD